MPRGSRGVYTNYSIKSAEFVIQFLQWEMYVYIYTALSDISFLCKQEN